MNDLISRQAAQAINVLPKFYREYQTGNLDDAYEKGWEDAMFSLNALPTIDPFSTSGYVTTSTDKPPVVYAEQKHGKWIPVGKPQALVCSECKQHIKYPLYRIYLEATGSALNFCPNCGSRNEVVNEN